MYDKPNSFRSAKAITKSDDTVHLPADAIYVGGAGNIVATINGADITFTAVPLGVHHLGPITKVKAASAGSGYVLLYY